MSETYIENINKPIRNTTQVLIELLNNTNQYMYGYADDFEVGYMGGLSKSYDSYYATYCDNGMKLGDGNCLVKSRTEDTVITAPQSVVGVMNPKIVENFITAEYRGDRVITLAFSGYVPRSIMISSEGVIKTYAVENAIDVYDVSDFGDAITIRANGIESGKRCRVNLLVNGYYIKFDNSNLTSVDHLNSIDLMSATGTVNKLSWNAYDGEGLFDPANPRSIYSKFAKGDKVFVRYGYDNEFIEHSTNYLYDLPTWDNDIISMTAVSWLEFLTEVKTRSSSYVAGNVGDFLPAYEIAEVCREANWSEAETMLSNAVINDMPIKDILQIASNAYVGYLTVKNKEIKFNSVTNALRKPVVDYHLTAIDMKDKYPKTTMAEPVLQYRYDVGNFKVSSSYEDVVLNVEIVDGYGQLILDSKYDNFVKVEALNGLPSDVEMIVRKPSNESFLIRFYCDTDKSFEATFRVYSYVQTNETSYVADIRKNRGDEMPISNPFITSETNIIEHGTRVDSIYNNTTCYEVNYSQDYRLELGDVILVDTKYEQGVKMIVTELHYTLPGRWGVIKGRRIS